MGTDSITCPSCGAPGSAADKFCGSCGTLMAAVPAGRPQPGSRKATMLGMTSVAPPGAPPAERPAAEQPSRPPAARKATMLGMTSVAPPGAPEPRPPSAKPAAPSAQDDPALQKTVLGMQSPLAAGGAGEGSPASAPQATADKGGKSTVFGVQPGDSAPPQEAAPAGPKNKPKGTMLGMTSPLAGGDAGTPASRPQGTPEATKQSAANAKGRTMLGMVSPLAGSSSPPEAAGSGAAAKGDPKTNRTMLGMVQPTVPEPESSDDAAADALPDTVSGPTPSPLADAPAAARFTPPGEEPSFSKPRGSGRSTTGGYSTRKGPGAGLWLGIAAVICAAVVAAVLLTRGGPEVSAEVVAGKQGDVLRVRVPKAEPGTHVRFAGNEVEVHAGAAEFPLAADQLKVGANHVSLDLVEPGGDVETAALDLLVDYRARLDLSGLEGEQPAVRVVIDAVPGSGVQVAGKAVELDAAGRASVDFPVQDSPGGRFDLSVPYRIEPPRGSAVEGSLELHLPVVSMQIDRPGEQVFTDADHIEIGGAVEKGASVHVAGKPVRVNDGRFLHSQSLGAPGEYRFSVVARAPGKAPSAREVRVTRVENMAIAAAAFEFDAGLSYARIAQNPAIYRGQHVAFDGRVYNVEVQGGRSILQMLVRDCPRGHKCQLWVDYAQATDATVGSMVRVLGVVSGEQQYRSRKGGVQTAPAVSARFVLPLVK